MKNIFIILLLSMFGLGAFAQTLSPKATVTAGGEATGGGVTLSFTIGETYNSQLTGGGKVLTEGVQQPEINLATGIVNTSFCAGSSLTVPYTAAGYSDATNTFSAQISDASGSFANAVSIGTVTSTQSGSISANIPNTASGTGYRIRVVSSNPSNIGSENGVNISVSTLAVTLTNNVIHPTCTEATGTITVSASLSSLSYSIDGINYSNTTGIFSNVSSGTYSVTAKNLDGCTSAGVSAVVNAQPAIPSAPSVNITHPSCTVSTGSIAVANATAGNTYSITGDNYSNTTGIFSNMVAGTYYLTVKSGVTTCISLATTVVLNLQPTTPAQPIVSTNQPTCGVASGTITVTSTLAGLTFSSDGNTYTNTTGIFTLLTGSYSITAVNSAGCISSAVIATVNTQPVTPLAPTATVIHPTCIASTGTITITNTSLGNTYSIDGLSYANTTGVFSNVNSGTYNVTIKSGTSGCISPILSVTINVQPPTPAAPTASVTQQPTCLLTTGTITVSSSITNLSFSINGSTYTNTTGIFSGLVQETYSLTAMNLYGCISNVTSLVVNSPLEAPVVTNVSRCGSGSLNLYATAPTNGTVLWYDAPTGGNLIYQSTSPLFTTPSLLVTTIYYVQARTNTGCLSTPRTPLAATINPIPINPIVSITQLPFVALPTATITVSSPISSGMTYSIDGSTYTNTSGVFSGLAPTTTYNLRAKNVEGCISNATSIYVGQIIPDPPVVTSASRCGAGIINLYATSPLNGRVNWYTTPTGGTYIYTSTSPLFTTPSLTSTTTYYVEAMVADGQVSTGRTPVVATINPIPSNPIVSVTQPPLVSMPTATITVSSPMAIGMSYSIDGTTYTNTSGIFSGLAPTTTYNLRAKSVEGCISNPTAITVGQIIPDPPVVTSASRCGAGTLILYATTPASGRVNWYTTPTGGTSIYSSTSTSYTTPSLTSTTTYYVQAIAADGQVSATRTPAVATINPIPSNPIASVTQQPIVAFPTATITVSSPIAIGMTYSINGTTYTNTSGIFSGLAPTTTYNLRAKNVEGCISAITAVYVGQIIPDPPVATAASRCGTGTLILYATPPASGRVTWYTTATGGTSIYSSTSSLFTTPSLTSTTTYYVEASSSGGQVSTTRTTVVATINPIPSNPVASVIQPTTALPTATITINSPIATGMNYSVDGGITYTTSNIFSGLTQNKTYSLKSKTLEGCICTNATAVVVTEAPPLPPSVTNGSRCGTGQVILYASTSTGNTIYWYTNATGGTAISGPSVSYSPTVSVTTTYYVASRTAAGTSSDTRTPVTATVSTTTAPSAPTVTVTQPTVGVPSGTITVTTPVTGLTFSIDGTTYTNTTGIFTGVAPGSYNVKAKNACGTVSSATVAVINAIPTSRTAFPTTDTTTIVKVDNVNANNLFDVNAFPNPTYTDFKLVLNSTSSESIKVTIYTLLGRMVSTLTFNARQTLSIGNDLKDGTYMVEVRQGANVKTLKLVKYK